METNFEADGWLGILMGVKLWINFHDKRLLDSSFEKLVKQLKEKHPQEMDHLAKGKLMTPRKYAFPPRGHLDFESVVIAQNDEFEGTLHSSSSRSFYVKTAKKLMN